MRTQDVLARYGSQKAAADAIGITRAAVSQWGPVVPFISALRFESMTDGELRLEQEAYDSRGRVRAE